jgi:hypothetical protein
MSIGIVVLLVMKTREMKDTDETCFVCSCENCYHGRACTSNDVQCRNASLVFFSGTGFFPLSFFDVN